MLARIGNHIQKQFCYGVSAPALAFIRISFYLGALLFPPIPFKNLFNAWKPEIAWEPASVWLLFPSQPQFPAFFWKAMVVLYAIFLLFSAFGFFYRISTFASAVLAFIFFSYANSIQLGGYLYAPLFWAHLILALSPADSAWSLSFIKPKKSFLSAGQAVRWLQWNFCLMFFCAALAKIRLSAGSWFSGDILPDYFIMAIIHGRWSLVDQDWRLVGSLTLAQPLWGKLSAYTVIFMEFFAPLMFFSRSIRPYFGAFFLLFQLMAWIFLLVDPLPFLPLYACWLVRIYPLHKTQN